MMTKATQNQGELWPNSVLWDGYETLQSWAAHGKNAVIAQSTDAAPYDGRLLVSDQGEAVGSLGSPCLDAVAIDQAATLLRTRQSHGILKLGAPGPFRDVEPPWDRPMEVALARFHGGDQQQTAGVAATPKTRWLRTGAGDIRLAPEPSVLIFSGELGRRLARLMIAADIKTAFAAPFGPQQAPTGLALDAYYSGRPAEALAACTRVDLVILAGLQAKLTEEIKATLPVQRRIVGPTIEQGAGSCRIDDATGLFAAAMERVSENWTLTRGPRFRPGHSSAKLSA